MGSSQACMLALLMAEVCPCPCTVPAGHHVGHRADEMRGGRGPPISLTASLPQGQPVPGRAGAPHLHGASVPEGEEGAQVGGGGDSPWGSRRRELTLQ